MKLLSGKLIIIIYRILAKGEGMKSTKKRNISLQEGMNDEYLHRKNTFTKHPGNTNSYDFNYNENNNLPLERKQTYEKPSEEIIQNLEKKHYFKDKSDLNKIGIALYEQGKFAESIEFYFSAIELDNTFKAAFNNLGNALRKQKRFEEALKNYNRVLELDPKCKEAHNGIGNTYDAQKNYAEAIVHYKKALFLDSKYKGAYNNLGKAQENLRFYEEAIKNYTKALELDPEDKIAKKNITRCKKKALASN